MPQAKGQKSPVFKILSKTSQTVPTASKSKLPLKVVKGVLQATKSNPTSTSTAVTATSKVPFKFSNKQNPPAVTKVSKKK